MKVIKRKSKAAKTSQTVTVRFECKSDATGVFLAGSFNDWNESGIPMSRDTNGIWAASLDLLPGRYEYKFIVDGQWCCSPDLLPDPGRALCVPNTLGTLNFAVDIGPE
jgi:1,4-alpha-glucan branching enzyme